MSLDTRATPICSRVTRLTPPVVPVEQFDRGWRWGWSPEVAARGARAGQTLGCLRAARNDMRLEASLFLCRDSRS